MMTTVLVTAQPLVKAPLVHKGKVVTDRISAFDYVLRPAVPDKGYVLNELSKFWFNLTSGFIGNHMIHADIQQVADAVLEPGAREQLKDRIMVVQKANRIPVECVVRGYITGGGWRQYQQTGAINGKELPEGLRKNQVLAHPLFTPALKKDTGHDEEMTMDQLCDLIGEKLAVTLQEKSVLLYAMAHAYCEQRGIILADTKFEFGFVGDELVLIDELFTPDSSRYWEKDKYELDIEIDSMDKEPVRTYLAGSGWDRSSEPEALPASVVEETSRRYMEVLHRLVD